MDKQKIKPQHNKPDGQKQPKKKRTWMEWLRRKPQNAGRVTAASQSSNSITVAPGSPQAGLRPLQEVRTSDARRETGIGTGSLSMMGMYLGGISGGFTPDNIPEMKRDPDVSLGLEYLLTPILNAKITVQGMGDDLRAQEIFDRFWQHDLECFKDMFTYGYCPAEVRYREVEEEPLELPQVNSGDDAGDEDGGLPGDGQKSKQLAMSLQLGNGSSPAKKLKLDYDGMIPLLPDKCEPYVNDGKLAYVLAFGKIKLEGNTDKRPAKGFWLANDPTYSPFIGNSVLPGAWLFWRAKVGMPDSVVENLLKANYKCAFTGLKVRYPSEDVSDDDGNIYDMRGEAEWYAENVKAGSNVVLPSDRDEEGNLKWDIESYGGNPIDISKLLPLPEWLTKQIHRGMGVVDDVITKEGNTGGYSRSNVSRQMFLMLALRRARRIAHTFDQTVCRPLMKRNGYPGEYKIDVKIPGMEDDPNGPGGGNGGDNNQEGGGGQAGGEGEEGGPLAKLFQQTMAGGKAQTGAKSSKTAKSSEESEEYDGPELGSGGQDMSLGSFLASLSQGMAGSKAELAEQLTGKG